MRLTLDGFCLSASLAQEALTLFSRLLHHPTPQIRPSSAREEKETRAFICEYTPAATSQQRHPAPKKEKKTKKNNQKTQKREKHKHSDVQTDRQEAQSRAQAHALASPRHTAQTDRQTHNAASTKHSTARSLFYAGIF